MSKLTSKRGTFGGLNVEHGTILNLNGFDGFDRNDDFSCLFLIHFGNVTIFQDFPLISVQTGQRRDPLVTESKSFLNTGKLKLNPNVTRFFTPGR